jgi:hypothetical protein
MTSVHCELFTADCSLPIGHLRLFPPRSLGSYLLIVYISGSCPVSRYLTTEILVDMGKKPSREANRPDGWSLSLDPHTKNLPTPDVWDKVLVNEIALLANFLQSHARDVG